MMAEKRTDTPTLISALRELSATIQCDDGVANAAITEAAERLQELAADVEELRIRVWEIRNE